MQQSSPIAYYEAAPNHGAQTSYNYGHITNHFAVPNSSPNRSTKTQNCPQTTILIPFRRDPDFVERNVLSGIYERCLQPAGRTALVGLGGVGKSQLAIECAYRIWDTNHGMWVFWVYASNATRFQDSYKRIAEALQLPGFDSPETDILHTVYRWLSEEHTVRWFMVIDNADDPRVLFEPLDARGGSYTTEYRPSLSDYLPQSRNGSLLITSRTVDVAFRLTGRHADILAIEPMDATTAIAMMKKRLRLEHVGHTDVDRVLHRLAQRLDYMPLAISQAVAYVVQRAPRVTVLSYIDLLEMDTTVQVKLLQHDLGDPRREGGASNSIILTWHVSFNHIRILRKPAAELLAFMSLFDRDAIPTSLLTTEQTMDSIAMLEFEDNIDLLRSYHLIQNIDDDQSFSMHRLVQLSTQQWLKNNGDLEQYQDQFIHALDTATPTLILGKWAILKIIAPHAQKLLNIFPSKRASQLQRARVLKVHAEWNGLHTAARLAEAMIRESRNVYVSHLGPMAIESLSSNQALIQILHNSNKLEEAECICRETLTSIRAALKPQVTEPAPDAPNSGTKIGRIAKVLKRQSPKLSTSLRAPIKECKGTSGLDKMFATALHLKIRSALSSTNDYKQILGVLESVLERQLTKLASTSGNSKTQCQCNSNRQNAADSVYCGGHHDNYDSSAFTEVD